MSTKQKSDPTSPQFLQQRITRFAVFGIIITALIIGLVTGLPLYLYAKNNSEKSLQFKASSQALAIRAHLLRYQDIAKQITSRTRARERLVSYNLGHINDSELATSIGPILSDAMSLSSDIAGITRIALDGNTSVHVGLAIPNTLWEVTDWNKNDPHLQPPVEISGSRYLIVHAAIKDRQGIYVGADIVAYRLDRMNALIENFSAEYHFGALNVGWQQNGSFGFLMEAPFTLNSSKRMQAQRAVELSAKKGAGGLFLNKEVIAFSPISGFNWTLLISVTEADLYRNARQENLLIFVSIILIILLGIWGTHKLIRPLAGKVLIHADGLRKEVNEKTDELQKINQALKALSAGNEVIIRSNNEIKLLTQVCEIIVSIAGYKMAWVGYAQYDDHKSVLPVAQAGFENGYLENLNISWKDNQNGSGPASRTIRTKSTCFSRNIAEDKSFYPWSERALERGYAATIALPISNGFSVIGALTIYSETVNSFGKNERNFLLQLANDLSYGISLIRAQKQHEKSQDEMRKLSRVVEQADNMVVITNCAGIIEYVNPEFEKVTGYYKQEVLGQPANILKSEQHVSVFYQKLWKTINNGEIFCDVFINKKRSGDIFYEEKTITPIKSPSGEITHFVSTGKDISERIKDQQRIEHLAYHDNLTNLPNRELFRNRLEHALAQSRRKHSFVAIMYLDIDRFKQVNDSLGHTVGDLLLKSFAERLLSTIREGDTIARIGGDEFTIICEDCDTQADIAKIAAHIVSDLSQPFFVKHNEIYATASIGVAIFPDDAENTEDLLTAADTAMYRVKMEGRNNYQFYTADMSANIHARVAQEADLRRALKNGEFELFYQPRVSMVTREVSCVEVLLRWHHPEKGLLIPNQFLSVLEETNLIVPVTEYVVDACCRQLQNWQSTPHSDLCIAVNLSVNLFRQAKILEITENIIEKYQINVSQIELEITENLLVEDIDSCVKVLNQLKTMGFQITIDDFGTGFSSMSYLKQLPIDCIKIDQSFVQDVETDKNDKAIIQAIISLAHSLELKVTAEGVENREQLQFLSRQGCDEGQGYWYSPATPIHQFEGWLTAWNASLLNRYRQKEQYTNDVA